MAEAHIVHRRGGRLVNGTVDLIIVKPSQVTVLDYKTTPFASLGCSSPGELTDEAKQGLQQFCRARGYDYQMKLYRDAVGQIIPDRPVNSVVYFTAVDWLLDSP